MSGIRALILDVDGVLTDGGIHLDAEGKEIKRFHTHDGVGIKLALAAGWRVLFCTARESQPARHRAEELGAEWSIGIKRKREFLESWLARAQIPWEDVAFVGDDLQDLEVLQTVGWPVTVHNGVPEVKAAAKHVTSRSGGEGAVREAVHWLLGETGLYERAVQSFLKAPEGFSVGEEKWSQT